MQKVGQRNVLPACLTVLYTSSSHFSTPPPSHILPLIFLPQYPYQSIRVEKENYVPTSLAAMDKKNFIASGFIEMRVFATLLSKTDHLSLSYMQAAILISAGEIDESGVIDYFDLLPLVIHGNALLATPQNKAQLKVCRFVI